MLGKKKFSKRAYDRKKYGANILFVHNNKSFSGKIKDISLSGAFVITPHAGQFSKNDMVTINIPFVNQQSHVSRTGRIVRITAGGFAVEFL
ncbi:MAG: PilZ domain-containing protein [Desulfobacteraceae bacterium]|jgi:hypothetical protein